MFDECIILAGGSGTRLWPLSSGIWPKQFLPAPGCRESFFALAVRRAFSVLKSAGKLTVIVARNQVGRVITECAGFLPTECARISVIPEPEAKNTAAAIACGVRFISASAARNCSILALTADHIIEPEAAFYDNAAQAVHGVKEGGLVVFGIRPTKPETGYGYIHAESAGAGPQKALSFHEKPGAAIAQQYLEAGSYYWNSGMFAFTRDFITEQFHLHCPHIIAPFEALHAPVRGNYDFEEGIALLKRWDGLKEAYGQVENASFDCAVAEKCARALMIPADFSWIDVGSWDEYASLSKSTPDVISVNARNNYVHSDIAVALCGVDDLIVVIRNGEDGRTPVALITRKGQSQNVRAVVEQAKALGRDELC